ncbi:MAG TPA: helix-turn-helix transcriptional regulator [Bacillota bacterium]|nr:helix-turn-helix transcriptional regulator [Bacillota bacterium]
MDLGRRLREVRKSRRMSLYDVERRTGRHFSTIGKYERGERRPSVQTLRELADVYQVSLSDLLGEDAPPARAADGKDLQGLIALARRMSPEQVAALTDLLRLIIPGRG